jgi:hypothetical protein
LTQLRRLAPFFPFSLAGLLILAATVIALRSFGYGRMDLVIFALTVCVLAIVLVSLMMVTVTGIWLRSKFNKLSQTTLPALQAEAGFPNETGFCPTAFSWLPLMKLEWRVEQPDAMPTRITHNAEDGLLEESITPQLRCQGTQLTRLFTLQDVLGLCRFSWRCRQAAIIQVLPQTGKLRDLPVLRSMDNEDGIPNPRGNPDGDRMDIRRYAPGDSTRNIMWRVYARNRHLNVRLPEKSMFQADRTLAYLVSGESDEAAAGVARFALSQGTLGSPWIFGADGSQDSASTPAAALPIIAGSRQPGRKLEYGLDRFLGRHGSVQSACVVFAPAQAGAWSSALAATLTKFPGTFTIILATDKIAETQPGHGWKNLILLEPAATGPGNTDAGELRSLIAGLVKAGARVWIVDRQSGFTFDQRLKRV